MFRRSSVRFIVTVLLTLALAACGGSDDSAEKEVKTSSPPPPASAATVAAPTAAAQPASSGDGVTKFSVVNQDVGGPGGAYKFKPDKLQFSVGETVEFSVTAETEFHTFNVDELDIAKELDAGETVTFTFTFDTPGEYRLYCIPHESLGMVGTIIVK